MIAKSAGRREARASAVFRLMGTALAATILAAAASASEPLRDAPVTWYADDRRDIPEPAEREPNLLWNGVNETFLRPIGRLTHPGRLLRRVGTIFGGDHVQAAANVNALDEVPNGSWFNNRIGLFPLTPAEAARGPMQHDGPDRTAPWTVVSAKTQGVTPGFNIRDARGDTYLIKFDPPGYAGMTSSAGVITGRILHAAGYFVPEDAVVDFQRFELVLGDGVSLKLPDGSKRLMTDADIDRILESVDTISEGRWRAISSRFLKGKPLGPFDYKGRRGDDPNDRVNHEDRRELRGLRMFSAWLSHFDMKQHNSLDMFVEENGAHYVRHHLIDFASTLGAGASGPWPKYNFEYSFDAPAIAGRTLALGLHEDAWRRVERPAGLDEVGYFESELWHPLEAKPLTPNTAFANFTDRDGYWAAKIISAFNDAHIEALVAEGQYLSSDASGYVARILGERRDRMARFWFDRVPPLDFFTFERGTVRFHDLGAERGHYPGAVNRYRVRGGASTASRAVAGWSDWSEMTETAVSVTAGPIGDAVNRATPSSHPFIALEYQVDRGAGWSSSVRVYVSRAGGRVVALDR